MSHKYLVRCWVSPQSGFDLAQKNKIMTLFREMMTQTYDTEEIENAIKKFEKENEGKVLLPLIIESDTKVTDIKKQILPEIQKKYPGANILSVEELPVCVQSKSQKSPTDGYRHL
jgi:hypothetical protein